MLLLGGHWREDDARARQTHVLSVLLDVGLTNSRETKKPQHTVGHTLQDLQGQGSFKTSLNIRNCAFILSAELKEQSKQLYETYVGPHLKSRGVNLVELVEVAVYNRVLWQTILGASCHNNCSWHLLTSGSFVIDLKWGTNQSCLEVE